MNEEEAVRLLNDVFTQSFDKGRFTGFVRNLFHEITFRERRITVPPEYDDYVAEAQSIGTYVAGNETIGVLTVRLKRASSRDRARTMQRNFVAKYLETGARNREDAALVAFYGDDHDDWRFSFVRLDWDIEVGGDGTTQPVRKLTPARRFSFLVGVHEPNHTCRRQFMPLLCADGRPSLAEVAGCFSVENVTKEFFTLYKTRYLELKEALEAALAADPVCGQEFSEKNISTVDFSKKLLGQIVFLYFLQKKGWLGVTRDPATNAFQAWGEGPRDFMRRLFDGKIVEYKNFFNDVLEPLFYEALASDRSVDHDYYSRFKCKIPFLNGGLFEPILNYNWAETELLIDNGVFKEIFETFDQFNFTIKEDEPLEREVAVDPEMLGKVFENLLDVTDRKSRGAFYTPREIVHYMCQQSLIGYLANHTDIPRPDLELFIRHGDVALGLTMQAESAKHGAGKGVRADSRFMLPDTIQKEYAMLDSLLACIKVVDPAVGSGAFPVGMMNEIVKARSVLSPFFAGGDEDRSMYELKRRTIEHSLYGVDLDSSAVDIAKLRFWLSLIVDEENIKTIRPLPNLDHKIMCGNSLVEEFEGVCLFDESLLGEPEVDPAALTGPIDAEIDELGRKLGAIATGKMVGDEHKVKQQIKQLNAKRGALMAGPKEEPRQVTFDQALSRRVSESQRKLRELKTCHRLFFNEQNRTKKKQYRDRIERMEWELIEETLREDGHTDACKKLAEYRKNKVKPFFLWKLYFSEVFQGLNPGFDVVIANPPYVRQESLKEQKAYFKDHYDVYQGTADLYAYFIERGVNLLAEDGQFTYIVPNKWMRANYGKPLRAWLREHRIEEIIDFGDLPVFESATTYPCIIRIGTGLPRSQFDVVQVETLDYSDLTSYVHEHGHVVNQPLLDDGGWSLSDERTQALLEKLKSAGIPLGEYVDGKIYYGIKTGLNEAFVIDEATKDRLIAEDSGSSEVIKPFLAGRDIKRYQPLKTEKYLIFTRRGIDLAQYPAIERYLEKFKEKLMPKPKDWGSSPWPGRKPGSYQWYEIQDSIDYYREFEKPKIILPDISLRGNFTLDSNQRCYCVNTAYIIPVSDQYLLGVLNSNLTHYFYSHISSSYRGGYLRFIYQYLEKLPIRTIDPNNPGDVTRHDRVVTLVENLLAWNKELAGGGLSDAEKGVLSEKIAEADGEIDRIVYELYGLTEEEISIVEGSTTS